MSDKRIYVLVHDQARQRAAEACRTAPEGWTVLLQPPKRTDLQNARMWAMLGDVSKQVIWHGQTLTPAEWKDMLTAALKKQRAIPGIDGGFVILGAHTSGMSRRDLGDLIDLMFAFGNERDVQWTDPTLYPPDERPARPAKRAREAQTS
jgi:hypothetical protein